MKNSIEEGTFLVDVRTPAEFAEGHAKGTTNIPLDQLEDRIEDFTGHPNIVVFCRSGQRSAHAKTILEEHGLSNVTNGGTWNEIDALLNP